MRFLSEESVLRHKEYLRGLKLKYSVLEKSYPEIRGLELGEIYRARIDGGTREECLSLFTKIMMHDLYFNSFCDELHNSMPVRESFGSEANFLYEIELEISQHEAAGFLLIFFDRKKRLKFKILEGFSEILLSSAPVLALDLYEHAYFSDYGFDRKRYVKSALSHLNLNKINDFCKTY